MYGKGSFILDMACVHIDANKHTKYFLYLSVCVSGEIDQVVSNVMLTAEAILNGLDWGIFVLLNSFCSSRNSLYCIFRQSHQIACVIIWSVNSYKIWQNVGLDTQLPLSDLTTYSVTIFQL